MKLVTAIIKPFKLDEVREALSAIGSDAKRAFYTNPPDGKNLGKSTVVVGLKYNF